jgi:hypothetical protein
MPAPVAKVRRPIRVSSFYPGVLAPFLSISMAFPNLFSRVFSFFASVIQRRVRWVSGTPGKPPAYAGTDFIVARNGRIASVYLFFDSLP